MHGTTLKLSVRDDGIGLRAARVRHGIGLSNTRSRLQRLYGDDAAVMVRDHADGGVIADIELPIRTEGRTAPPRAETFAAGLTVP